MQDTVIFNRIMVSCSDGSHFLVDRRSVGLSHHRLKFSTVIISLCISTYPAMNETAQSKKRRLAIFSKCINAFG